MHVVYAKKYKRLFLYFLLKAGQEIIYRQNNILIYINNTSEKFIISFHGISDSKNKFSLFLPICPGNPHVDYFFHFHFSSSVQPTLNHFPIVTFSPFQCLSSCASSYSFNPNFFIYIFSSLHFF